MNHESSSPFVKRTVCRSSNDYFAEHCGVVHWPSSQSSGESLSSTAARAKHTGNCLYSVAHGALGSPLARELQFQAGLRFQSSLEIMLKKTGHLEKTSVECSDRVIDGRNDISSKNTITLKKSFPKSIKNSLHNL